MKKDGDKALESGFLFRFLFTNIQPSSNYRSLVMSHRYCSNTSTRDETALNCFHTQINKLLIKQKKEIYSRRTEKRRLNFHLWQKTTGSSSELSGLNKLCLVRLGIISILWC